MADAGIFLSKIKYWLGKGGAGNQYMSPEAYLQLRLIKTTAYPPGSYMELTVEGEHSKSGILGFKAQEDSMLNLKAFGNETSAYH